jgi:transcriptional regulator with XRE-family HTH domain
MDEASWFGARLRELRQQAGLTQQQVAERCGVKWETVSRWGRDTREPSWSNVVALAKALGVECTAFLQDPGRALPPRPGRPPKPAAESADQQQSKRPRGRPRKAPAAAQVTLAASKATSLCRGKRSPPRDRDVN